MNRIMEDWLKVTAVHKPVQYELSRQFSWFSEEISNARREDGLKKTKTQFVIHLS